MSALIHQRCFNHGVREAVAQCPACARFFCRECVTEHDDRLLCAGCVEKLMVGELTVGRSWRRATAALIVPVLQLGCATLIAWLFFYWVGQTLLSIDPAFHEGTMWRDGVF
jgi:hypothetical protein